jgi:methylenetetrahydrofolate dehydrogenase (NADP+)/methenyltetrahydrofolate cyclohydrolase
MDDILASAKGLKRQTGKVPGLAVIRVGDNPASIAYIRRKCQMAEQLGFFFQACVFDEDISESELKHQIHTLNQDPHISGIILQLPLPHGFHAESLLDAILPEKDVDGLHPLNRGRLFTPHARPAFVPCTPLGCVRLLQHYGYTFEGEEAIVVGTSTLVGRPLAALLLRCKATVTMAHSKTRDLEDVTRRGKFVFLATGCPELITSTYVHSESVIVDVGISLNNGRLTGDVDFESVASVAQAITPVPGGVGPMTVMSLMYNVLKACYNQCDVSFPLA